MTDSLPVPPASERRGVPGHDRATDRANAIRLLTLRAQKLTYAQIADELGYADASGARQALIRALDRHEAENVEELRAIENHAMDADERALNAIKANADSKPLERVAAVNALTRVRARRARLNGLDAPIQVALSAGIAAELEDALTEAEQVLREQVVGKVTASYDEPLEG